MPCSWERLLALSMGRPQSCGHHLPGCCFYLRRHGGVLIHHLPQTCLRRFHLHPHAGGGGCHPQLDCRPHGHHLQGGGLFLCPELRLASSGGVGLLVPLPASAITLGPWWPRVLQTARRRGRGSGRARVGAPSFAPGMNHCPYLTMPSPRREAPPSGKTSF